ncbi:MAG: aminotransferase class I/II-fold pyridoxal phosphate-dependent enzyme [Candidatus Nanopelagicales bacterium]
MPAAHNTAYRFDEGFLDRLLDPSIKVFFVINPGNPDTRAIRPEKLLQLRDFVLEKRPDLLVVADTAYATFVDGFEGILSVLPRHTIVIHSFSKNYGATGNRLGFVAMAAHTVVDEVIAEQPDEIRVLHDDRYSSMTSTAAGLPFMARVVADSREVALHNIAGLSTTEQVQMALFALAYLMPSGRAYVAATRAELARRSYALFEPLRLEPPGGQDSLYYALVHLVQVARARRGDRFASWLVDELSAEDIVLRLATEHGVIVQAGSLFRSEAWDVRASLASLEADQLRSLGVSITTLLDSLPGPAPGAPNGAEPG